eukprot:snap_masked-scaffold_2-processed-gene-16.9-mRNA-1 protein AED:1.00 eAED:1.00 QI:0/-1/0/0/-1/1/1/0/155
MFKICELCKQEDFFDPNFTVICNESSMDTIPDFLSTNLEVHLLNSKISTSMKTNSWYEMDIRVKNSPLFVDLMLKYIKLDLINHIYLLLVTCDLENEARMYTLYKILPYVQWSRVNPGNWYPVDKFVKYQRYLESASYLSKYIHPDITELTVIQL